MIRIKMIACKDYMHIMTKGKIYEAYATHEYSTSYYFTNDEGGESAISSRGIDDGIWFSKLIELNKNTKVI